MRLKEEMLMLPVDLTPDEIQKYGEALAAEMPKQTQLEAELKEFKKTIDAHLATVMARIGDLSNRINQKKENRPINCKIIYQFEKKEKIWVRPDTGAIVKREPISPSELQEDVDFDQQEMQPQEREEG